MADYCSICQCHFDVRESLLQHFQQKHPGAFCIPCKRPFISKIAKRAHINTSSKHFVCQRCPQRPSFDSQDSLETHTRKKHSGYMNYNESSENADQLTAHNEDKQYSCTSCNRIFESPANLKMHQKTHASKKIACFGCDDKFVSTSAMVLHLEAGRCESGVNCDRVTEISLDSHEAYNYTCEENGDFEFECPTCETPFRWMSGLLQHVESDNCEEDLSRTSSWASC